MTQRLPKKKQEKKSIIDNKTQTNPTKKEKEKLTNKIFCEKKLLSSGLTEVKSQKMLKRFTSFSSF